MYKGNADHGVAYPQLPGKWRQFRGHSGLIPGSYPGLTREDIRACLAYAAQIAQERVVFMEMSNNHAVQA